MKSKDLEELRELWEDKTGRYVLIQSERGSTDPTTCVAYDLQTQTGLVIEDDDLADEVMAKMAASGVPMLSEFPK